MKIAIITEESGTKFVTKQKDLLSRKIRKGVDVSSSCELITQLKKHGFNNIPSDDLQNEGVYKSILREYIKPAQELYAGRFREIKIFVDTLKELKGIADVDISIISGRYGLVKGTQPIIPYKFHMKERSVIKKVYQNFGIHQKISSILNNYGISIILLPTQYLVSLCNEKDGNIFNDIKKASKVIIVSGASLFENIEKNTTQKDVCLFYFQRRGVARIGKKNQERIIEIIKREL